VLRHFAGRRTQAEAGLQSRIIEKAMCWNAQFGGEAVSLDGCGMESHWRRVHRDSSTVRANPIITSGNIDARLRHGVTGRCS
jgi:hypothetical protein